MGALFHRERTGEATVVDVSLLNSGMWAMGQAVALSLLMDMPWVPPSDTAVKRNPLVNNYLTKDGRYLSFCCLQAGKYWAPMCEAIDRAGPRRRPPIRRPRIAARQQRRGHRHPGRGLRRDDRWPSGGPGWPTSSASGPWSRTRSSWRRTPKWSPTATSSPARLQTGRPSGSPRRRSSSTRSRRCRSERRSSTSTATPSSPSSGLDWDTIVDLKVRGVVA